MSVKSQGYGRKGDKGDKGDASTTAGPPGKSAYEVAVAAGFAGTQAEWLASLKVKGDIGPSARVALPSITVAGQILVGVLAGPRKHTIACAGAQVGDALILTPAGSMPTGYMLGDASCLAANQLEVTLYTPAVTLLANYSIAVKVVAVR